MSQPKDNGLRVPRREEGTQNDPLYLADLDMAIRKHWNEYGYFPSVIWLDLYQYMWFPQITIGKVEGSFQDGFWYYGIELECIPHVEEDCIEAKPAEGLW